jgi:hypothetical protein
VPLAVAVRGLVGGAVANHCYSCRVTQEPLHPPPPSLPCLPCQVGYFHAFQDGVDYVFVDHPCFHAVGGELS